MTRIPNWIDAHIHLTDARLENDLPSIIEASARAGIHQFVLGGIEPAEWEKQKMLARDYTGKIYASFGLHPWWVAGGNVHEVQSALRVLRSELETSPRTCIAIGETGLDYSGGNGKWATYQIDIFRKHLQLALEFEMPLVLHIVQAHGPALEVLKDELRIASRERYSGIVHSFSGEPALARAYLDLGVTPSISAAVITREKGSAFENLTRTVVTLSATEFVLETDAPDQPPAGESGLNHPANLIRVAERIAGFRETTAALVLDQSSENLRKIFKL